MEDPRYRYEITVRELMPPVGPLRYYATVAALYERTVAGDELVMTSFGNRYGKTANEARKNIEQVVLMWIDEQPDRYEGGI
jgi:hypothetical protein